jgi:hypothetical protein
VANRKQLVLETTEKGCVVPTSHRLNQDGYFRKRIGESLIMYHRYVWEQAHGSIPFGYEIDHKCRNRACCNLDHLQMLTVKNHKIKTNEERYAERNAEAKVYWMQTNCTGTELGKVFGVTYSCGCKWIRIWKLQ